MTFLWVAVTSRPLVESRSAHEGVPRIRFRPAAGQGIPRRPHRLARLDAQGHPRFLGRLVVLSRVAGDAGGHAVLPRCLAPPRSRQHVVEGQVSRAGPLPAILADELVPPVEVAAREDHAALRDPIVEPGHHHLGGVEGRFHGVHLPAVRGPPGEPLLEGTELEGLHVHDPDQAHERHHHGTPYGGDVDGNP